MWNKIKKWNWISILGSLTNKSVNSLILVLIIGLPM